MSNRIQKHHIRKNSELFDIVDTICSLTNNLRNECLRIINNHFKIYGDYDISTAPVGTYSINSGCIFMTASLFQILKDSDFMQRDFVSSKVMKKVMQGIEKDFRNYFKSIKKWSKNKSGYKGKPKTPEYRSNKSRHITIFESECVAMTLNSGYISIGGNKFIIDIPNIHNLQVYEYEEINNKGVKVKRKLNEVKEVCIVPSRNGYNIIISYSKLDNQRQDVDPNSKKYMGIDPGVSCLLTLTSNHLDWTSTMISGAKLKKLLENYHHKINHFRKNLPKNTKTSKRLENMMYNRFNRKMDICHKISRLVVDMAIEQNISKIVIGNNKFWKNGANLGRSQKLFQSIPYEDIIFQIRYKAQDAGIIVIVREESFTSICSFLDMEPISRKQSYIGKRIHRSIFKSGNHGCIHADVNGSLNILRKEVGNSEFDLNQIQKYKKSPKHLKVKLS